MLVIRQCCMTANVLKMHMTMIWWQPASEKNNSMNQNTLNMKRVYTSRLKGSLRKTIFQLVQVLLETSKFDRYWQVWGTSKKSFFLSLF